ncbi:MAG: hypothetical protein V1725_02695 [archaeon]
MTIKEKLERGFMYLLIPFTLGATEAVLAQNNSQDTEQAQVLYQEQLLNALTNGTLNVTSSREIKLPDLQYETPKYAKGELPKTFSVKKDGKYVIKDAPLPTNIAWEIDKYGRSDALKAYAQQLLHPQETVTTKADTASAPADTAADTTPPAKEDTTTLSQMIQSWELAKKLGLPQETEARLGIYPAADASPEGRVTVLFPTHYSFMDRIGPTLGYNGHPVVGIEGQKDLLIAKDKIAALALGAQANLASRKSGIDYKADLEAFLEGRVGERNVYLAGRVGYGLQGPTAGLSTGIKF